MKFLFSLIWLLYISSEIYVSICNCFILAIIEQMHYLQYVISYNVINSLTKGIEIINSVWYVTIVK